MSNETKTPEVGERVWIDTSRYSTLSGYWATVQKITPSGRINVAHCDGSSSQYMRKLGTWQEFGRGGYHSDIVRFGEDALAAEARVLELARKREIFKRIGSLNTYLRRAIDLDKADIALTALEAALKGDAQ